MQYILQERPRIVAGARAAATGTGRSASRPRKTTAAVTNPARMERITSYFDLFTGA